MEKTETQRKRKIRERSKQKDKTKDLKCEDRRDMKTKPSNIDMMYGRQKGLGTKDHQKRDIVKTFCI